MKDVKWNVRWRAVLLGAGTALLAMVVAAAVAAGLMAKGAMGIETIDLWSAGILAGSALIGCLTAMLGGGGVLDAVLAVLGELVVLIAINAGLNGGEMEGFAVTLLALVGGCGAAVLLRMGKGSGRRSRRRRRKNR